jgi:hypothetical protein
MGAEWENLLENFPFLKDLYEKKKKNMSMKDYTAFYNIKRLRSHLSKFYSKKMLEHYLRRGRVTKKF